MSDAPTPAKKRVALRVIDRGAVRIVDADEGTTVREALLGAGISPYTRLTRSLNCGGRGLCATCGVRVLHPAPSPTHWHDRLAAAWGYPRLSCQLAVKEGLAIALVDKVVWGGRTPSVAAVSRMGRALLVFSLVTPLAMAFLFEVTLALFPARTPDGYGLMPIGQAGFALVVGPIVGLFAASWAKRPASRDVRKQQLSKHASAYPHSDEGRS